MDKEAVLKRLNEVGMELGDLANECALEHKGQENNAGVFLHEAVNNIWKAEKCLNGENQDVPPEIIARSMGADLGDLAEGLVEGIEVIAAEMDLALDSLTPDSCEVAVEEEVEDDDYDDDDD